MGWFYKSHNYKHLTSTSYIHTCIYIHLEDQKTHKGREAKMAKKLQIVSGTGLIKCCFQSLIVVLVLIFMTLSMFQIEM